MKMTSVDRVLSKHYRDIGEEIPENDAIEWIGEAMEFISVPSLQEQALMFSEVNNFHCNLPNHFQTVIQILKYHGHYVKVDPCTPFKVKESIEEVMEKECNCPAIIDECGELIDESQVVYYRPYFDLQWEYDPFCRTKLVKERFSPVRLTQHNFFNTVIQKDRHKKVYQNHGEEYIIVAQQKIRFSFQEGYVVMAYYRNALDQKTGFPLIPDEISIITAIEYYLQWKMAERKQWNGREGFANIAQQKNQQWLKYCMQAKNGAKLPKSLDEWQNLMERQIHLLPNYGVYNRFFGNRRK
jgi:hypothetical protein